MIVADALPKSQKEKVDALFYRMVIRRLLRKWAGRMLRSRELHRPRINRTSSRSKEPKGGG
jgi:hypothetical protein